MMMLLVEKGKLIPAAYFHLESGTLVITVCCLSMSLLGHLVSVLRVPISIPNNYVLLTSLHSEVRKVSEIHSSKQHRHIGFLFRFFILAS